MEKRKQMLTKPRWRFDIEPSCKNNGWFFPVEFNVTSSSLIGKPPDHYFSPAVCYECHSNKLFKQVELFWNIWIDGIGDIKSSGGAESVRCQSHPVCQRRGEVGARQHIVGAVRHTVRAAKDQVATRYLRAVDHRL